MIIELIDLIRYPLQVTLVDGAFDPLHSGHLDYFEAAGAFGFPLLCAVCGDAEVTRKHPVLLPGYQRVRIIDALRVISYTYLKADGETEQLLRMLRPKYYVKGADWRGRLPVEQRRVCRTHGIPIRYTETKHDSSSARLRSFLEATAS